MNSHVLIDHLQQGNRQELWTGELVLTSSALASSSDHLQHGNRQELWTGKLAEYVVQNFHLRVSMFHK
uniref:Uncharacterized protein n=1 Tax=Aegilops tauschii subsp. strangulata TaxID=200361 RepID=A0A453L774_AEGTS